MWIKEIVSNSAKKVSIVHFVKTSEYSRPVELIKALRREFSNLLIFNPWTGLKKVIFVQDNMRFEDCESGIDPIASFSEIITRMRECPTLAVVENFDIVNRKINSVPDLNDALRYIVREYDINPIAFNKSMLVIFLKDISDVSRDIIDHTLTYNVEGCTEEERKKIITEAIKGRKAINKWIPENPDVEGIVAAGSGLTKIQFNTALVIAFSTKQVTPQYIASAKRLILETSGVGKIITPESALSPDKIGGYDEIKKIIMLLAKKVTEREKAAKLGCGDVKGFLFFGPPGTGKSLICEAFAKMANRPVLSISAGDIFSKWYGESARTIRKIIEIAEEAKAIIFIDEIEAIVGGRQNGQGLHEETSRTLGELLAYMGDPKRKSIVIGTTNRPDLLDFAMRRAGRFDKLIYMPFPDFEARKAIFNVHINNPIDHQKVAIADDVDIDQLAKLTENYSGAEIAQVVKDAADYAFEDETESVQMLHFLEAIETNKPNMKNREQMIMIYERYAREFSRGMRLKKEKKEDEDEKVIKENEEKESLGRFV